MSLPISLPKIPDQLPFDSMLTVTRTAFGLGVGLLVAERIKQPARQMAAIALVSVGAIAAVPYLVKLTVACLNRPESERANRNRLRSIRDDHGYPSDHDVY